MAFQYGNGPAGPANPKFENNLIYDIYDDTESNGSNRNYLTCVFMGNTTNFTLANNTYDNLDVLNGVTTRPGVAQGLYGGVNNGTVTIKNNVFRSSVYYQGPALFAWNAGLWLDGGGNPTQEQATYSCVYWGAPSPPPFPTAQVDDYLNWVQPGVGCITMEMLIDPNYNLTPGPGFYHPQAAQVLTGGEGGTQMGCFGGPYGNWTPPSQQ